MKKFLLLVGILLCLQSCTFARNLVSITHGSYMDIDSIRREGNYGYIDIYSPIDIMYNGMYRQEFDLINRKFRIMKIYVLNKYGKIDLILREDDFPEQFKGWNDIPPHSTANIILEILQTETNAY